ncbi:MAG: stage III sporulation protein AB [Oscillospiraceae bacterium]
MTRQASIEFIRAARLLPPNLRSAVLALPTELCEEAEELRLRVGRAPTAVLARGEIEILPDYRVLPTDLQLVLEIATRASVHAYSESIKMGFVTGEGGCRVGLCGTAVSEGGSISGLRRLSSVCIRIPREKQGCADGIYGALTAGGFASTLLVSPPGEGKTTLLRELIRRLSDEGRRLALVDERNELAGSFEGQAAFDLGSRTDILSGAPKGEGIFLLLRSMAPQIIAFDEITAPEDVCAAELAANCGVSILATAHGLGLSDLQNRPLYKNLLERKIFRRAVIIEKKNGRRFYTVEELN